MKLTRLILLSTALLAVTALLSVGVGSVFIPPLTVARILLSKIPALPIAADWPQTFSSIIFEIRLPHTALMILAGGALASSGAVYQGLFRNPLADPFLIGVASGAGLGAVLVMALPGLPGSSGLSAVPMGAFAGASLTITAVYFMARVERTVPTTTLILAGVAVSSFANSLTSFLMLRSNEELRRAFSWLLGGSILNGWDPVLAMLPYLTVGLVILLFSGHSLNVIQFGEEQAQQLGLPVERLKLLLILAASLTTASAVAFAGIIGFLGLIVPHILRITTGPDYRQLIPLSILGGGSALLIADAIARVILSPQSLPVGIVTALAGAPFFLWVLRRAKNQAFW